MENSYTSLEDGRDQGLSSGYYPFMGGFPVVIDGILPYTRAILPSAGLVSNAEDMTHYLSAHLDKGEYQGVQMLSRAGVELLHTPGSEISPGIGYGMGWVSFEWKEIGAEGEPTPQGLTHSGSWLGYAANMVIIPEREVGVIVLLNSNDPLRESVYANIGFDLARIVMGLEALNNPPNEDLLTRNGRAAGLGMILLLVGVNFWLRGMQGRSQVRLANGIVYGFELVTAGVVGFYFAQPISLTVRFSPDMALVHLVIFLLTAVWGTIRTGLVYRAGYGK
jgi:CubicO group peptidase (beta-lactamase class C family)